MLDRDSMSPQRLVRELLGRATPDHVVVLDGGIGLRNAYLDRVAAGLLVRRRRSPHVVMTDSTWTPGRVRRAALRAMDSPRTTYCVLSSSERTTFPVNWGVDPERVAFTPFYWTLPETEPTARFGGQGVFAGGDSLRDHQTLVTAAGQLDVPVTIATRGRPPGPMPGNVTWGPIPPQTFLERMRNSAVVAVPLLPGLARSAGQQTYLNAMVLGKPVVVSDVPGARDHIVDGETGLLVPPGDADALAAALRWAADPANAGAVRQMGERARDVALRSASPDRYVERLLDVIDGLPT
jgi:hypothetical protein